jgi:hypothetical protein
MATDLNRPWLMGNGAKGGWICCWFSTAGVVAAWIGGNVGLIGGGC